MRVLRPGRRRCSPASSAAGGALLAALITIALAPARSPSRADAADAVAPPCVPGTLDRSAELPGTGVTVSPTPGTLAASAATQLSFLGAAPSGLSVQSVRGSKSGMHAGRLIAYSQGDGASWMPEHAFTPGETVVVTAQLRTPSGAMPLHWQFTVAEPAPVGPSATPRPSSSPASPAPTAAPSDDVQHFRSRPDLQPPTVTVTVHDGPLARGDIFMSPYAGPGQAGPMIFDSRGRLVWFHPVGLGTQAADLQVQTYDGRPVLTWWENPLVDGLRQGEDVIFNGSYSLVDTVRAGNGLSADHHDFQLEADDEALVLVYEPIRCNLSAAGGSADGAVWDGVFQDIDVATGLVREEWHALDHVGLDESYISPLNIEPGRPWDFFHINSIDRNLDGSLMISARHTWTVYDIDPRTLQVVWRLGGKQSSFAMGDGTRTGWQHDARELPNGEITIFDNGAGARPRVHAQSRGILERLDLATHTATLVGQLEHTPPLSSGSQGDVQALPDGHWIVGWGEEPYVSEFDAGGQLIFDAHLPAAEQSYRAFRFPWTGTPRTPPALAVSSDPAGGLSLAMSWNGATEVHEWEVLGGPAAGRLRVLERVATAGFETDVHVARRVRDVAVRAVASDGAALGTSAVVVG